MIIPFYLIDHTPQAPRRDGCWPWLAGLWLAVGMGREGVAGRAYAGRVCGDRGRSVPCPIALGCPFHPCIVSLPALPILGRLCAYLVASLSLYRGPVR